MLLFDLSDRTKILLTGSDRVRFLNGQVTNDVRKVSPDLSLPACVVNAKGRMDGLVFISASPGGLFLDAEPELREALPQRLERYIIADDVTLEDVTERFSLFHVTSETGPSLPNEEKWREAARFGLAGWDLVVPAEQHGPVRELLEGRYRLCDAECMEQLRIEQGIPRWGRELTNEIIPVEANLESEAIDYAKGCYIGQEVISRMKMSGQTNKRLCGLVSAGPALAAGMKLQTLSDPAREVGWLTSATRSERLGKEIALGFVKRGHNARGNHLLARAEDNLSVEVEIVALPFAGAEVR